MNISVIGGGNVGTLIAGEFTKKNNNVTIYTRDKSKWQKEITVFDNDTSIEYSYIPYKITEDVKEAVSNADIIFITLPAFAIKEFINKSYKYIKKNTWIGFYPGTGASKIISKQLLDRGCIVFGTQRICSVVRLKEYGKSVATSGKRSKMYIGVLPYYKGEIVRKKFSELFDIETTLLPNYLNVTLTPSNPILHPVRLYTLFKKYKKGITYKRIPLFYEDWDDETSKLLVSCDEELHSILEKISLDTSYVRPLLEHYESKNYIELTRKIKSIKGFKGLKTPSIELENGYIPDFSSRYFTADIPYGLVVIKSFAMIYNIKTPNIDIIINWYQKIVEKEYIDLNNNKLGKDSNDLSLPQLYRIKSNNDIIKFYNM